MIMGILYAAPTLLYLLVNFVGFLFAITQIRRFPRPASWLAVGLAVLFVVHIVGWLGFYVLVRTMGPENFQIYNLMMSSVLNLMSAVGLVFMIYAVFASRANPADEFPYDDGETTGNLGAPKDGSNPY